VVAEIEDLSAPNPQNPCNANIAKTMDEMTRPLRRTSSDDSKHHPETRQEPSEKIDATPCAKFLIIWSVPSLDPPAARRPSRHQLRPYPLNYHQIANHIMHIPRVDPCTQSPRRNACSSFASGHDRNETTRGSTGLRAKNIQTQLPKWHNSQAESHNALTFFAFRLSRYSVQNSHANTTLNISKKRKKRLCIPQKLWPNPKSQPLKTCPQPVPSTLPSLPLFASVQKFWISDFERPTVTAFG
jgi:hypothetical protein